VVAQSSPVEVPELAATAPIDIDRTLDRTLDATGPRGLRALPHRRRSTAPRADTTANNAASAPKIEVESEVLTSTASAAPDQQLVARSCRRL